MAVTQPGMSHQPTEPAGAQRRKGPGEQVVESVASGFGNGISFLAESGVLFAIFAVVWGAFAVALIWSQGSIDAAWQWIGGMPLILQAVIWLLFLPVMIGMWVWETTCPFALRLLLVIGIGGWNLIVFLPRARARRT